MPQLSDKVALVTGASRGIGFAIAKSLAKKGAIVVGTATTDAGANQFQEKLKEENLEAKGIVLNVADPESITNAMASIIADIGQPSILINNAGITRDNLGLRMKDDEWLQVIDTNLNSVYRVTKAVLRGMLKLRWGRIVCITSVVGFTGNLGQANYAAAKAGMVGFSKSLAQELAGRNITVNTVAPGFIETDMTNNLSEEYKDAIFRQIPAGRIGRPEEVAAAVAFLVSEGAAYITGSTIHVNGGMYMN